MSNPIVGTATLMCTMGAAPSSIVATSAPTVMIGGQPAATVMDFGPMSAILPFGMCMSPSNPQVAAATSAAAGVLTPQPCIPNTVAPWMPGSVTVTIGGKPAARTSDTCMCIWGGQISAVTPAMTVTIG